MENLISIAKEERVKNTEDIRRTIQEKILRIIELRQVNTAESLELCRSVISQCIEENYPEGAALGYRNAGVNCRLLSKYDDAFEYFEKALDIYNRLNDETGKARVLNSIGNIYLNLSDYKYALEYLHKCLSIAQKTADRQFEIDVLNNIGLAYQESGDYTSSLEYNLRSIQACTNYELPVPESLLNNIGIVYQSIGDYETAYEYYSESLKIAESKDNLMDTGFALGNISFIHSRQGRFTEALECLNRSLDIFTRLGNRQAEANAFYNMGREHGELKDYTKAIECEQKALLINEEISDHSGKAATLLLIGDFYKALKSYDEAREYYIKGLRTAQDIGDIINETNAYQKMGELFLISGTLAIALDNLEMALSLAESRDSKKDMSTAHKMLFEAYKASKNPESAMQHLEDHYRLEKDIYSLEYERKLKSLTIQYHYKTSDKERKIALQEKEIYRLKNVELADANSRLMKLIDEKNEFMGIAAHDLKNPLSGILVYSKKISSNIDKYSKEQIKKIAGEMETASERMFRLIEKFLDVNMIESGRRSVSAAQTDCALTLKKIIELNRTGASEKNIKINENISEGLLVKTDEDALAQILDNLVSNAVKFTERGKNIYVNAVKTDLYIRFSVRDEGPGITPKDMNKLFTRFSRLSAQPTGNEISTGLGLSIAKKLVLMLGGKIWCESTPGEGAEFFVELPAYNDKPKGNSEPLNMEIILNGR